MKSSSTAIDPREWLEEAKVGVDPCRKRGDVCRGAYISEKSGVMYLRHDGQWQNGASSEEVWWETEGHALAFLNAKKREPLSSNVERMHR